MPASLPPSRPRKRTLIFTDANGEALVDDSVTVTSRASHPGSRKRGGIYSSRTGSTASTAVSSISSSSSGPSVHHPGFHSFDVRALITGYVWYHDHHEYVIQVEKSTSQLLTPKSPGTETPPVLIQRRYRAFHRLHRTLGKIVASEGDAALFCDLPRLPPKRYFGSKRKRFVARRQRALQSYLDAVLIALSGHGQRRGRAWAYFCRFLGIAVDEDSLSPHRADTPPGCKALFRSTKAGGNADDASDFLSASALDEQARAERDRCGAIVEGVTRAMVNVQKSDERDVCEPLVWNEAAVDDRALRRLFGALEHYK